jgi:hypothetical protein
MGELQGRLSLPLTHRRVVRTGYAHARRGSRKGTRSGAGGQFGPNRPRARKRASASGLYADGPTMRSYGSAERRPKPSPVRYVREVADLGRSAVSGLGQIKAATEAGRSENAKSRGHDGTQRRVVVSTYDGSAKQVGGGATRWGLPGGFRGDRHAATWVNGHGARRSRKAGRRGRQRRSGRWGCTENPTGVFGPGVLCGPSG